MKSFDLPVRKGGRPRTTDQNPHTQLDQNPSREMHEALAKRLFALPSIVEKPSGISVPGARALAVPDSVPAGPPSSFMVGREFAHLHPPYDGSLHAVLPPEVAEEAIEKGWAELHPLALRGLIPMKVTMLYGPRDEAEIEIVLRLVEASRRQAFGET